MLDNSYSVLAGVIATALFVVMNAVCAARAANGCLKLKSRPPFVGSHNGGRCR